jgi:hypothetical protein
MQFADDHGSSGPIQEAADDDGSSRPIQEAATAEQKEPPLQVQPHLSYLTSVILVNNVHLCLTW